MHRNSLKLPGLILALLLPATGSAAELDPLVIDDVLPINPAISQADDPDRLPAVNADGADLLDAVTGVSISRFGGRGLEPIIHGQTQTRLNVLLDGAYVHGGCPNRMDPPASWAALETYEQVTVLKGVQTVVHGGGGSGGSVLFERDTRALALDPGVHGRVSGLASDNAIAHDLLGDVVISDTQRYLRVFAQTKKGENYTDGDGREVRAAFKHRQFGTVAGWMPNDDRLLEITIERNDFSDALYPGAGMDSPSEKGTMYRFRYLDAPRLSGIDNLRFELYRSDISHLMDNYSLRTPPRYTMGPMSGMPMLRSAPTTSLTDGGRLVVETRLPGTRIEWGIDWQLRERNAILYNVDTGAPAPLMYLWPGVDIDQTGVFAEATHTLAEDATLKAGLRIDRATASADRADVSFATPTPNAAYQTYYGVTARDVTETNVGGLLRYETRLKGGWQLFSGISRSVRTADATERYMNNWNMTPAKRWIGNPALAPEKHHQLDAGLTWRNRGKQFSVSAWYDRVQDYILRDTARGQTDILLADGANVYRNVEAELRGIEIETSLRLRPSLRLNASAAWVHGDNTSDDRPLPQIPPLEGQISLDYGSDRWGLGSRLRFALEQDRIDPFSTQEVGPTPGWQAVDLYAHYRVSEQVLVRLGIDNVFDETYARHASRSNLLDPVAVRVNEPGRTLWVKASATF